MTVDLNGQVVARARGEGQPRATELVLSNSRLEGDPIVFNTNRRYLDQAAKLGFRDVHLFGNNVPALCRDGNRQYARALLEPGQPIASNTVIATGFHAAHLDRLRCSQARESPNQAANATFQRATSAEFRSVQPAQTPYFQRANARPSFCTIRADQ